MSDGWTTLPMSEAVEVNPTVRLKKGAEYPFVEMADVSPSMPTVRAAASRVYAGGGAKFDRGDTLVARITPCLENGKVARYVGNGPANGSTEFIVVRGREGVTDDDFAHYLTAWPEFRDYAISQMTGSSGRQRVPTDALDHLEVPVPPLPEQRSIARTLGVLDARIALNRRTAATLEALARRVFRSWFVDFDPVRTRRDGTAFEETGIPGLGSATATLFPDRFEASDIGQVPAGWKVVPLPDFVQINPKRILMKGADSPYVGMKAVPEQGSQVDGWYGRPFTSGSKFVNGDTLMARITPCLENGKTAFVDFLPEGRTGWGSTEFHVLRPHPPCPPTYAYFLARSDDLRDHAIRNMTGTSGRQRVPADCFNQYLIARPPDDLLKCFGELTDAVLRRVHAMAEESRTLAAIRDRLLPKLIGGDLRVPVTVADRTPPAAGGADAAAD